MWRRLKLLVLLALVALFAIQLYRPQRTNPTTDPKHDIQLILAVDPQVASILKRSCNDCHSNQTVWPWYGQIAPASWLIVSDVNRGRTAVNFSEWNRYNAKEQKKRLEEVCSETSAGEMPAFQYLLMHPNARLSAAEKAAVCRWSKGMVGGTTDTEVKD